jgi:hypothetical protein
MNLFRRGFNRFTNCIVTMVDFSKSISFIGRCHFHLKLQDNIKQKQQQNRKQWERIKESQKMARSFVSLQLLAFIVITEFTIFPQSHHLCLKRMNFLYRCFFCCRNTCPRRRLRFYKPHFSSLRVRNFSGTKIRFNEVNTQKENDNDE